MADAIRPRFRYIIVNLETSAMTGTDDQSIAEELGMREDNFAVLDAETQEYVCGQFRSPLNKH